MKKLQSIKDFQGVQLSKKDMSHIYGGSYRTLSTGTTNKPSDKYACADEGFVDQEDDSRGCWDVRCTFQEDRYCV
ncbi:MAG: rSAM-modified peptide [Bacteroidetes bacterium]|nr:MAG: rSAM-modified peptide [Bacteroidota bacterium]